MNCVQNEVDEYTEYESEEDATPAAQFTLFTTSVPFGEDEEEYEQSTEDRSNNIDSKFSYKLIRHVTCVVLSFTVSLSGKLFDNLCKRQLMANTNTHFYCLNCMFFSLDRNQYHHFFAEDHNAVNNVCAHN